MRQYRRPFPDNEDHWVTVSAEFICLAVAWGEPGFAAQNQKNLDAAAAPEPKPGKKNGKAVRAGSA